MCDLRDSSYQWRGSSLSTCVHCEDSHGIRCHDGWQGGCVKIRHTTTLNASVDAPSVSPDLGSLQGNYEAEMLSPDWLTSVLTRTHSLTQDVTMESSLEEITSAFIFIFLTLSPRKVFSSLVLKGAVLLQVTDWNPQSLEVKMGDSWAAKNQIISHNYHQHHHLSADIPKTVCIFGKKKTFFINWNLNQG